MRIRTPGIYILLLCLWTGLSSVAQEVSVNRGYEKGLMKAGYKTGTWEYYDSTGALDLAVDYDKGVLAYLRRDTTEYAILKDGRWVFSKVDIPPRYIGSWVEFYEILNSSLDYPMQARYRDVVGTVHIAFEVDTTGRIASIEPVNDIGCECAYECMRVLKLVPNYWLVANIGGVKYRSRFIISCEFGIILDGKRLEEKARRGRKNREEMLAMPVAREIPGISYVIRKGYSPK